MKQKALLNKLGKTLDVIYCATFWRRCFRFGYPASIRSNFWTGFKSRAVAWHRNSLCSPYSHGGLQSLCVVHLLVHYSAVLSWALESFFFVEFCRLRRRIWCVFVEIKIILIDVAVSFFLVSRIFCFCDTHVVVVFGSVFISLVYCCSPTMKILSRFVSVLSICFGWETIWCLTMFVFLWFDLWIGFIPNILLSEMGFGLSSTLYLRWCFPFAEWWPVALACLTFFLYSGVIRIYHHQAGRFSKQIKRCRNQ